MWILLLAGCGGDFLGERVLIDGLYVHLDALQQIAFANDGNRAAFTPGYDESVAYVTERLEAVGYEVEHHEFTVPVPVAATGALEQGETPYEDGWLVAWGSASGDVTAEVVAVDVVLPPGEPNSSTSGCEAADYDAFPEGAVALVQRGTCTFAEKVEAAQAAGAAAVLLFNEGQRDRTETIDFRVPPYANPTIPILGLSFDLGAELAELPAGTEVHVLTDVTFEERTQVNVITETPEGDPDRVLMVGAHLDSVPEGPGINDNATGSALVLEMALQWAGLEGIEQQPKIRFAWWGAEEIGLVGSWYWVDEHEPPAVYLNYDMVGSPNGAPFLYDGTGSFGGYEPSATSAEIEGKFTQWFLQVDLPFGEIHPGIDTDSRWFVEQGSAVGGLFTGASGIKSGDEAALVGGAAGVAYDPCYHQACDDITNVDPFLYDTMANGAAILLHELAVNPETF